MEMRTLLFAWLCLIVIDLYAVSGQCLSHQQSLLLQLKETLIFNKTSSRILVKWNQGSDCCTWEGVTCEEEGRVTGLKLRNESISGGIFDNSSLFNLQFLKSLDLSSNSINSTIPTRIGNLTNLSYLNFSNAGFEGHITKEISKLTRLVTLDLSVSYSGLYTLKLQVPNLSKLVQKLAKLEELYLDGVNISTQGNEWGQALSSSLPNLRVLSLSNCYVSGPIDQSLLKLHSLAVIRLDYNNLSTPVTKFFGNFTNLTSLGLSYCSLYGIFPNEIFQVSTLRRLDISGNELLQGSLPEFPKNNGLQNLVIFDTNFTGRLPASIGNLQNLSILVLSSCKFDGTLPNSMKGLTKLVHLDLSDNNFTGLIPSFNMSKNLTHINLSLNWFTGPIPSANWEGLLDLNYVDLRYNFLNGNIPASLFSLPSLQTIQLSFNQFSGQVVEFPNGASSKLGYVDLRNNNLEGPIPSSFFRLGKLKTLLLSSNKFNGTIQLDMIQGLSNLKNLYLSYNNLSVNASGNNSNISSLPKLWDLRLASCKLTSFPYLDNQSELSSLDHSDNQIYGEVPSWVWAVSYLNQLHGKIPILQQYAGYIDLSSNYFSSIPADIGDSLAFTNYVSLANNALTGVIPKSICSAARQVLDLSNNRLNGRIPTCMLKMSHIFGLSLRRNDLSGPIPDAFPVNCGLQTLYLNGNLLTGKIPKSLANCRVLEFLDIGNNHMHDTFPLLLKSIFTLNVLILRSNKFYGRITCRENIGAWPLIQIVDLASNNFSGELPRQCLTKWNAMMVVQDGSQPWTNRDLSDLTTLVLPYSKYYPTVTNKGLELELVKIPYGFTAIDFSSNNFQGEIPKELGQLRALHVLNLSHNALSGQIPSSFGNLLQLESLDLSRNSLNGEIPPSLSNLNFLSFMNLSFNQLIGRIPKGSQIQTFSADCFKGNEGLCGPPLTSNCTEDDDGVVGMLPEAPGGNHNNSGIEIEWDLIGFEIGFLVGFGILIGTLVSSERWRKCYFDRVEDIAYRILPQLLLRKWLVWKMNVQN